MSSSPKFTLVLDPATLAYYRQRAAQEDRTPSAVMRRVLKDAAVQSPLRKKR